MEGQKAGPFLFENKKALFLLVYTAFWNMCKFSPSNNFCGKITNYQKYYVLYFCITHGSSIKPAFLPTNYKLRTLS